MTFLSPPTIARVLGVSPSKVRGFIERGELKAVNLAAQRGRRPRYRVSQQAFDEFLARREVQPRVRQQRRFATPANFVKYY